MTHRCHAEGCNLSVPPHLFMCKKHWFTLPRNFRDHVWGTYRPGQERDKKPSDQYMVAHHQAVAWLAEHEGLHSEAERHRLAAQSFCLSIGTSNEAK